MVWFDDKTADMTAHNSIANIRGRLNHPVIDSDGHWIEFEPLALDYLTEVGGRDLVQRYQGSASQFFSNRFWSGLSPQERTRRRVMQPPWWIFPTRNSHDRATAMLPRLLYERLDEIGLDFAVLYPSSFMLFAPFIRDAELRRAACRAFNIYAAQQFQQFAGRLTPAAVIPTAARIAPVTSSPPAATVIPSGPPAPRSGEGPRLWFSIARYAGSTSAQDQPWLPRAASPSQSAWRRIHIIPFTAADPPSTRPRSQTSSAPPGVTGCARYRYRYRSPRSV